MTTCVHVHTNSNVKTKMDVYNWTLHSFSVLSVYLKIECVIVIASIQERLSKQTAKN